MKGFHITLTGQQGEHWEKKNMLLNKREATKTVKTGFDIWKGRFFHKKPFIGPSTREGLIKRR